MKSCPIKLFNPEGIYARKTSRKTYSTGKKQNSSFHLLPLHCTVTIEQFLFRSPVSLSYTTKCLTRGNTCEIFPAASSLLYINFTAGFRTWPSVVGLKLSAPSFALVIIYIFIFMQSKLLLLSMKSCTSRKMLGYCTPKSLTWQNSWFPGISPHPSVFQLRSSLRTEAQYFNSLRTMLLSAFNASWIILHVLFVEELKDQTLV